MARNEKDLFMVEHVTTMVIGIVIGLISYFPLRQWRYVGEEGAAYIGLFLSIIAVIISDRVFYQSRLMEIKSYVRDAIVQSAHFDHTSRYFRTTLEALDYALEMLPKASRIWNTRLYSPENAPVFKDLTKRRVALDKGIMEQVLAGACLDFVCSSSYTKDIEFVQSRYASSSKEKGEIALYLFDTHGLPLIQMIIIEFADGRREALIGWIFSNKRSRTDGVWSVRDSKAVDFFLGVFETYKECAKFIPTR